MYGQDPSITGEPVYKCGASIDFKIKAGGKFDIDNVRDNQTILFDVINFNNFGNGFFTVFQALSCENWTDGMMYNYMDSFNQYFAAFYFVILVLFGTFFILNFVLA